VTGDPARAASAEQLAARLGHEFCDAELLPLALTHRSWCAENPGFASNERLEFLGDAVLGVVVTDHVYRTYATMPEGELAKLRAGVVSAATLAEVARELELGCSLRLGKGEDTSGGRDKSSILADALEAVFGALYVDGGFDTVGPIVLELLGDHIIEASAEPGNSDFKTQLQELAARECDGLPTYEVTDEGPDHQKRFFATVRLDGSVKGVGEGRSKKEAEQDAARTAWRALATEAARGTNRASGDGVARSTGEERERADA